MCKLSFSLCCLKYNMQHKNHAFPHYSTSSKLASAKLSPTWLPQTTATRNRWWSRRTATTTRRHHQGQRLVLWPTLFHPVIMCTPVRTNISAPNWKLLAQSWHQKEFQLMVAVSARTWVKQYDQRMKRISKRKYFRHAIGTAAKELFDCLILPSMGKINLRGYGWISVVLVVMLVWAVTNFWSNQWSHNRR